MPCDECGRLASNYRDAVRAYTKTMNRISGALGDEAALAAQKIDSLHRACIAASDAFLKHVKVEHPASKH